MSKNVTYYVYLSLLALVAAVLLVFAAIPITAQQEQTLKVGKQGEMTFDTETVVGGLTLKPGRYRFQHRIEGSDHFVHFTEVTKERPSSWGVSGGIPKAHPGELKCNLETLPSKASRTEVHTVQEGGIKRITKIVVKGENVAHLF